MIDIETLLVHHPTLTVGEYFKMFPLPDTPIEKPQSELSKQLEVQVLTYQSALNIETIEDKAIAEVKPIKEVAEVIERSSERQKRTDKERHRRVANEKIYGKFRIQKIVPNIPRLSY